MLIRIVKMTFQENKTEEFLKIFISSMQEIRHFPGCLHLELLQENNTQHIYYTYSYWKNEEALQKYRHSDLFKTTWGQTKVLFAAKPEAVSLQRLMEVE